MMYHPPEFEQLKAQVYVIAMNHRVSCRPTLIVAVARLKAKKLTKEEIETLTKFCEFYNLDFKKLKPVKEKKVKKLKGKRAAKNRAKRALEATKDVD
jgi:inorganic pyrophosphatase